MAVQATRTGTAMAKWIYSMSAFNKYGLRRDDLLDETDEVKEALRRLPQDIVDERNFRILRALHLSMCHALLPPEQWTKFEHDVNYLQPYIDEVRRENAEKREWNKRP